MKRLIFLRHGETDLAGRFCGQCDPPLNAAGLLQASEAAAALRANKPAQIFCSPLQRAQQTAEIVAATLHIPIEQAPDLREIAFGAWEGISWAEIEQQWPTESSLWLRAYPHRPAPGGESYLDFSSRVDRCIDTLLASSFESLLIVTHRGVLQRALTRRFNYSDDEAFAITQPYCACIAIDLSTSEEKL